MTTTKKQNNPTKKRMRLILIIIVIFTVWAGITVYQQRLDINEKKTKYTNLKQEEQELLSTKQELEGKVALLHDKDYIAELARKFYFLSKPGEYIFISPEE